MDHENGSNCMIAKRSATVLSVLPRDRRADEAGLRSSFWPDAQDVHGAYTGSAEGFIEFTLGVFKTEPRNIHQITNVLIEFISPAEAPVESYFTALQRGPDCGRIKRCQVSPMWSILRPFSEKGRGVENCRPHSGL
ncbi:hypothetical protein AMC87_PC00254 (plasmid) [Rhizobium phaseoli]|uniref:SnoaL-like protein n=1 Tax=Rhizobium etli (strain CIAT 652) TaxID=491916 RepID=B3Q2N8_RHIE6|nr:hypothetical protein RHECIAT_PB0000235 [Rhizobium etli CIAT 652]ANL49951.1 hypothetical protein AMC87_PC00254 [Rhizobium phaseoli]ARM91322.1 NTF2 domain-containing protein [Rhizobium sp. CIAT894]KKZ84739.1 hypothetical protein RPHASCH2410_PC02115 [Rhizobium phaseoli Ch24-10]OHV21388.1 hypothetical protein BBJ66_31475 [Rhizobium sp. RSm-3]